MAITGRNGFQGAYLSAPDRGITDRITSMDTLIIISTFVRDTTDLCPRGVGGAAVDSGFLLSFLHLPFAGTQSRR